MNVTETAQKRINLILYGDTGLQPQPKGSVFRVEIQGGGCTGFKYHFDITERQDDDIEIGENAVTDGISIMYLQDSILDFKNSLFEQTFVIENPNVKTTCGCGESIGF